MDTIAQLIDTLTAISVVIIAGASFVIVGIAGVSAIRMKNVRWDALGFTLVILWLIPIGIRSYGVALMQAGTDSVNAMVEVAPGFRDAMRNLVSGVAEPWDENSNNAPVTISQPTPQFTSTPMPTAENQINYDATATAYFGNDFPTALPAKPTETPRPMIEPTWTSEQWEAQKPTPFVCKESADHARGCLPPTPIPGN